MFQSVFANYCKFVKSNGVGEGCSFGHPLSEKVYFDLGTILTAVSIENAYFVKPINLSLLVFDEQNE